MSRAYGRRFDRNAGHASVSDLAILKLPSSFVYLCRFQRLWSLADARPKAWQKVPPSCRMDTARGDPHLGELREINLP